jgi:tetratricopeptide (TPR) repeat protein
VIGHRAFHGLLVLAQAVLLGGCLGEGSCRGVALDRAWQLYTAGEIDQAHAIFLRATKECPRYSDGRLGLAYTALRRGDLDVAQASFEAVLRRRPESVDALLGSALVHWRRAEFEQAHRRFTAVVAVEPANAQALDYLSRFPALPRAERSAHVLPDTLVYPARVRAGRFEVRAVGGWAPFYVKGMNLGAALPGRAASVFPDSATYAVWLRLMGAMGVNTVRVYTTHPPVFYQALLDYNREHAHAPLWLLHGVWAELPPADAEYDHPGWLGGYYGDLRLVVDIVHGQADAVLQAGRSAGRYTADVSTWTLGYILGREWEPHSVARYNRTLPGRHSWTGNYVDVVQGTAMDVWLGRTIEEMVRYETARYRTQRPVAYTNWPPTDALRHVSEADIAEEQAIRRALGDPQEYAPGEAGNDHVTLDPTLIRARAAFPAGHFAAYHVYPYYPDFLVLDEGLNRARSPSGPSNYVGYLEQLKDHHGDDMAVLIAEYGVSTAAGIAHFQPQGWHHGGNTEAQAAAANAQLTREIAAAGMAGGVVFAWIDEWFKQTWINAPFELPRERDAAWHNRMDPEENFGVLALEAAPLELMARTPTELERAWRLVEPLFTDSSGATLRAVADAAYLRVRVGFGGARPDEVLIGFDVLDPARGEFRWPDGVGSTLPVGLDFVLRVRGEHAQLLVHPPYNPTRIDTLDFVPPGEPRFPALSRTPPGYFTGRYISSVRAPLLPKASQAGAYEGLRVLAHRLRFGRDSTEYAAAGYDWGVLPRGPLPDGLWEWTADGLEVRIPWQLLNVADPSQRSVLADTAALTDGGLRTVTVPGIRMLLGLRAGDGVTTLPQAAIAGQVPLFTWNTWELPRWRARVRPTYAAIRDAWRQIEPAAIAARPDLNRTPRDAP